MDSNHSRKSPARQNGRACGGVPNTHNLGFVEHRNQAAISAISGCTSQRSSRILGCLYTCQIEPNLGPAESGRSARQLCYGWLQAIPSFHKPPRSHRLTRAASGWSPSVSRGSRSSIATVTFGASWHGRRGPAGPTKIIPTRRFALAPRWACPSCSI